MNDNDAAELERLELLEALMRVGFTQAQRTELEGDPSRALAIIEHAEQQHALRSIAGFTMARYRQGFDPRSRRAEHGAKGPRSRPAEPEPVEAPPTLSAIEYLWSRTPSPMLVSLEAMMGVAIGRSPDGLEGVLRRGWFERELYDGDGELERVERG